MANDYVCKTSPAIDAINRQQVALIREALAAIRLEHATVSSQWRDRRQTQLSQQPPVVIHPKVFSGPLLSGRWNKRKKSLIELVA